MTREELIQHYVYVPEKFDYDDIKLHIEMGYRVVGYNPYTDVVRYINLQNLSKRHITPFSAIDRLEWRRYGLFCKTYVDGYYV